MSFIRFQTEALESCFHSMDDTSWSLLLSRTGSPRPWKEVFKATTTSMVSSQRLFHCPREAIRRRYVNGASLCIRGYLQRADRTSRWSLVRAHRLGGCPLPPLLLVSLCVSLCSVTHFVSRGSSLHFLLYLSIFLFLMIVSAR